MLLRRGTSSDQTKRILQTTPPEPEPGCLCSFPRYPFHLILRIMLVDSCWCCSDFRDQTVSPSREVSCSLPAVTFLPPSLMDHAQADLHVLACKPECEDPIPRKTILFPFLPYLLQVQGRPLIQEERYDVCTVSCPPTILFSLVNSCHARSCRSSSHENAPLAYSQRSPAQC